MTKWLPRLDDRQGPRYVAIADALAADIGEGRLAPGTRLPTHRDLAWDLKVTVGTVSRAYEVTAVGLNLTIGPAGRKMGYCSCREIVGPSSVKESSLGGGLKQSEAHALSSWGMKPHIELVISDGIFTLIKIHQFFMNFSLHCFSFCCHCFIEME